MDTSRTDALLAAEQARQENSLCFIASENHVSKRVMNAIGSVFTNKYSEGEPRKRYYQGNAVVDDLEEYVHDLVRQGFGLSADEWHVNPKALSAGVANFCVENGLLRPGQKIMGLYLYDGGHLSHGWDMDDKRGVTIGSRIFDSLLYRVDEKTHLIDYDKLAVQAAEFKPDLLITGGTAYPRAIDHKRMKEIASSVGAYYMADVAHEAGLGAGGDVQHVVQHQHLAVGSLAGTDADGRDTHLAGDRSGQGRRYALQHQDARTSGFYRQCIAP